MKVFCGLLVLLAVFQASQCQLRTIERSNRRTPFNQRQRINVTPAIVGGDPANIADFPHHLGLLDLSWGGYICGASVISPLHSLSAAHCLEFGVPASQINLWGGSTSRISGGTVFFTTSYILHPGYDTWTLDNDIALINVDPNSPLSGVPNVVPAVLPPNCATACCGVCEGGEDITVIGWGVYNLVTGALPENLLQVQKAIFNQAQCSAIWGGITSRMFCTNVEQGRDSCNGDSGGSIMRGGVQVGIVSFGSAVCGDGTAPAVYVRVEDPMIRNFIRDNSGV